MLTRHKRRTTQLQIERQQQPQYSIPAEIWENVFMQLRTLDGKAVCQVCQHFWAMSRSILWAVTALKDGSQFLLKELLAAKLPIKHLRASQVFNGGKIDPNIKQLLQMKLSSFDLDNSNPISNRTNLNELCRLPITRINTSTWPTQIIQALNRAGKYPEVTLEGFDFIMYLGQHDWETLSTFPIISRIVLIKSNSALWISFSTDIFKRLDQSMNTHLPTKPRLTIDMLLNPSALSEFKLTKISELVLNALENSYPLTEYLDVLARNNQTPVIKFQSDDFKEHIHVMTTIVMRRLFTFKVPIFSTQSLELIGDTSEFAKIIVNKHKKEPFQKFEIDPNDFGTEELAMFKSVGLDPVFTTRPLYTYVYHGHYDSSSSDESPWLSSSDSDGDEDDWGDLSDEQGVI